MKRQRKILRISFTVAALVCAIVTSPLPATEPTTDTAAGSGRAPDSGSTAAQSNIFTALEILSSTSDPGSTEASASPFEPPGHGGTPPGHGGTPPGQTNPPGHGGTPPGRQ